MVNEILFKLPELVEQGTALVGADKQLSTQSPRTQNVIKEATQLPGTVSGLAKFVNDVKTASQFSKKPIGGTQMHF